MELFSQPFIQAVRQTLSTPGTVVLGTIPVPKGKPLALVEEIRNRPDVKVFSVSKPALGELLPCGHILAPMSSLPSVSSGVVKAGFGVLVGKVCSGRSHGTRAMQVTYPVSEFQPRPQLKDVCLWEN